MTLALTDLIDRAVLAELVESLWRSSGLPTKVIDAQGGVLASSGSQDLCFHYHRRHPVVLRQCLASDLETDEMLRTWTTAGPALESSCRGGLCHIGLPIIIAGQHLATLFLSQFFYDPPDEEIYRRRAAEFGFDEQEYLAALRRVPILDRGRVREIMPFYQVLVRLLTEMGTREEQLLASREELRRSEEKFRTLFQGANDALFIVDPDGRILDANDTACARLGYAEGEIRRMHVEDIDTTEFARVAEARMRCVLEEGVAVFETVHVGKDGREMPVEISARKIAIEGQTAILASARDLSERKRVETALRESEERFRSVIESIPLGVHLYRLDDDRLVLTGANPAADTLLGIQHAPFFGHTIEEVFPPLAVTEIPERYREVCRGKRCRSWEVPYSNHIARIFEVHAFPTGQNRMAVLFADISERKKQEEELRYRERIETLIAGVSTRFMEVGPAGLDLAITATLGELLEFAAVDRVYLFCLSEDGAWLSNTHEVCSAGTSCERQHLQRLSVTQFPWLMERLRARELVHIPRLTELPPEAAREKSHLGAQQIRSMLAIPVLIDGEVAGLAGFDAVHAEKVWAERDFTLLRTFGNLLGSALERRRASEALEYRARLEHLLATLSTRMVHLEAESIDPAIEAALAEIGGFVSVDRCYVFQFSEDGQRMSNTHEWCAPGIPSFRTNLQQLPVAAFPWFRERIGRQQVVHIPAVAELGPEAGAEKAEFERQEIRSLLCVPMVIEERVLGFIGFDAVRQRKDWPDNLLLLLRLVGEFFAIALERRQRDRELRESRERIAAILSSIKAGLLGVDQGGRLILLNRPAAIILDLVAEEARGQCLAELPIEAALQEQIAAVLAGEKPEAVEWRVPPRSGEPIRTIEARTDPIRDAGQRRMGAITILRDVSAEREMDRIKSEFISTAAHELRTPLSSVLGYAELLLHQETFGTFSTEEQREFLQEIVKKAEALAELVNDLLDLSRIESGQLVHLTRAPAPLAALLEESVADFRRRNPKRLFELRLPESPPEVFVDAAKIRQVLENLLGNAVKFSPAGSRIRVQASLRADWVEVEVTDEGTGMSPEVLARVFDKFYRGVAAPSIAGLGLGMSIVKNIVEAHGGEIRMTSTPGLGTQVTFTLPLSDQL